MTGKHNSSTINLLISSINLFMKISRFNSQLETSVKKQVEFLRVEEDKKFWEMLNELVVLGINAYKAQRKAE